ELRGVLPRTPASPLRRGQGPVPRLLLVGCGRLPERRGPFSTGSVASSDAYLGRAAIGLSKHAPLGRPIQRFGAIHCVSPIWVREEELTPWAHPSDRRSGPTQGQRFGAPSRCPAHDTRSRSDGSNLLVHAA